MSKTGIVIAVVCVVLGFVYLSLMPAASSGYGYMGYHGYHSGPSFFYFGGTSTYYGGRTPDYARSTVRSTGSGASRVRGGGPSSGK